MITDNFVKLENFKKTHDLYGVSPDTFFDMKYQDALQLKIKLAYDIITECHKVHYMKRDENKIKLALSAIKHNEDLINEMGYRI